jgi:nucleoside-diphosphate-sugar epimerase
MVLYIGRVSVQVFITGGTGYIGRQVIRDLAAAGHRIRAFIRSGSEENLPLECRPLISIVSGDIQKPETLRGSMDGCDVVIHLPGLIREFPRRGITFRGVQYEGSKNVINEACRSGVQRLLLMSANGVRAGAPTEYYRTKWMAEEYLRQSTLEWTIFRPSVVFGHEDEGYENFVTALIDQLRMLPFIVPVPGNGRFMFQPVSVRNLSEGIVKSANGQTGIGRIYEVGGIERFSFDEMIDHVAEKLRIRKIRIHQPMSLLRFVARIFGRYSFFPISDDQLVMLLEGNVTDQQGEFYRDFGITPILFSDTVRISLDSGT